MLISGRKVGESIRINTVDGIVELSVCPIDGVQLKIGVDIPQQTKQHTKKVRPAADRNFVDGDFNKQAKAA